MEDKAGIGNQGIYLEREVRGIEKSSKFQKLVRWFKERGFCFTIDSIINKILICVGNNFCIERDCMDWIFILKKKDIYN